MKLSKPLRKLLLIIFVMICSYATLLTIIHHSKELAKTESAATEYPTPSQFAPNN